MPLLHGKIKCVKLLYTGSEKSAGFKVAWSTSTVNYIWPCKVSLSKLELIKTLGLMSQELHWLSLLTSGVSLENSSVKDDNTNLHMRCLSNP